MAQAIYPGKMRERLVVQKAKESRNELGETTMTFEDFKSVWASVEGVSATENLNAGQQQIDITHRVKMRYLEGLTQKMQFKWRNRTLQIVSLLEHGNRSQHEVICVEDVD